MELPQAVHDPDMRLDKPVRFIFLSGATESTKVLFTQVFESCISPYLT